MGSNNSNSTEAPSPSLSGKVKAPKKAQQKVVETLRKCEKELRPHFSFEFFPPKTNQGQANLLDRMNRLAVHQPSFISITWNLKGKKRPSLSMARKAVQHVNIDVLLHLTITGQTRKEILDVLTEARICGIRNVLALRGDPQVGIDAWTSVDDADELNHAVDLVKLIRNEFGDYFCIGVGAYPEGHKESNDFDQDLNYLKEKIVAGADFVICQLAFDAKLFHGFFKKARALGITCPILPGLMPIQTFSTFRRIIAFSNISVPSDLREKLAAVKSDDAKVKNLGIQVALDMIHELHAFGHKHAHFYTMNLEGSVNTILEKIGMELEIGKDNTPGRIGGAIHTKLPWKQSTIPRRKLDETVRPIFWQNRQESYLARTVQWDEFPNGRWGDSRSPAYGDTHYYLYSHTKEIMHANDREKMWGIPKSYEDVYNVFVNYLTQKIKAIPWCFDPIDKETNALLEPLMFLNRKGFLTINSQPAVNGVPSTCPISGWGPEGGRIYQKAYLEFFCSPEQTEKLIEKLEIHKNIQYEAIGSTKEIRLGPHPVNSVNAVTWGVFPGMEILQPTIVDTQAFKVWKDEAFGIWGTFWRSLCPVSSPGYKILETIEKDWYLVTITDNDYIEGDIFAPFKDIFPDFPGTNQTKFEVGLNREESV